MNIPAGSFRFIPGNASLGVMAETEGYQEITRMATKAEMAAPQTVRPVKLEEALGGLGEVGWPEEIKAMAKEAQNEPAN